MDSDWRIFQMKKEKFVILSPKNASAKERMEYHGDKWVIREVVDNVKFSREPGPYLVLISRDGKKCLHIKKKDDKDFDYHKI